MTLQAIRTRTPPAIGRVLDQLAPVCLRAGFGCDHRTGDSAFLSKLIDGRFATDERMVIVDNDQPALGHACIKRFQTEAGRFNPKSEVESISG